LYISYCIHLTALVSCIYKKTKKQKFKKKKINFSFNKFVFFFSFNPKKFKKKSQKMAEFPNPYEFYNSYENQYNPFENQYNQFDLHRILMDILTITIV